jgi:two-component system OmpR family sensor kinase
MSSSRVAGIAARTPLRIKLVAALISLLVLGLAVTGFAAWTSMRSYLIGQVDNSLEAQAANGVNPRILQLNLSQLTSDDCGGGDQNGPGGTPYAFELSNATGSWSCAPTDASSTSAPALPDMTASQVRSLGRTPYTVGSVRGTSHWRVTGVVLPGNTVFLLAVSLDPVEHTLGQLVLIEVIGGLIVVLLLGGLGYALVRRSLRPLVEVERAAEDIAAGDLSRRVPELDPRTEVGRLSRAFNTMLGRIEVAFRAREESEAEAKVSEERMRRFVADASHELRTPLTSIRGFAELYRQGAVPDPADIARIMRRIEDQATRMGLLVEDLLMLARLDQQRPLDLEPVDLLTIASEAVQDARALEPDRSVELVVGDVPPPVVLGDGTRLRQVVGNLMSNALTHTPPGTPITVSVRTDGGFGELDVADEGPGMTAQDAAHVFERFYRADSSRARTSGGTGLGLSIAAALVAAHSGALTVRTEPGEGATFTLRIPSVAADVPADLPVLEPTVE